MNIRTTIVSSLFFIGASAVAFGYGCGGKEAKATQVKAEEGNIVTLAASASDFSTLVAAVQAAGLVDTLAGEGPFTVFAPTNEAFAKLPAGTVEMLLQPENKDKLVEILTYHVVPAQVLAKDVSTGDVKTVSGEKIAINVEGGKVMVNDAHVTTVDLTTGNGVIHVIDTVLIPGS